MVNEFGYIEEFYYSGFYGMEIVRVYLVVGRGEKGSWSRGDSNYR